MFTSEHFIWLALCAIFIIAMSLISIKKDFTLTFAGAVMTTIALISEVSKIFTNMTESPNGGMHLNPLCLPFHLCSLMIFAVIYITFAKDGRTKDIVINFVAVMGTLGSFCALMIPTNGTDFTQIDAYQCFVYHAGLMWFSIYLISSGHARLGIKSLVSDFIILLALSFIMLYVNGALSVYDTNFFYLTRPPMEGLPVLNLESGWYIYFLRLLGIGTGLISLFHIPFIIHERFYIKNS